VEIRRPIRANSSSNSSRFSAVFGASSIQICEEFFFDSGPNFGRVPKEFRAEFSSFQQSITQFREQVSQNSNNSFPNSFKEVRRVFPIECSVCAGRIGSVSQRISEFLGHNSGRFSVLVSQNSQPSRAEFAGASAKPGLNHCAAQPFSRFQICADRKQIVVNKCWNTARKRAERESKRNRVLSGSGII
jgi:hypothetical protein